MKSEQQDQHTGTLTLIHRLPDMHISSGDTVCLWFVGKVATISLWALGVCH